VIFFIFVDNGSVEVFELTTSACSGSVLKCVAMSSKSLIKLLCQFNNLNTRMRANLLFIRLFIYEQAAMNTLDGIIDTVSAVHPILPLLMLMKSHGKLVMVGAPEKPVELPVFPLRMGKHRTIISYARFQ